MIKIKQAKEKLFNHFPCHKLFHYDSMYGNFKDLKFHKGDDDIYFVNSKGLRDGLYDNMDKEEWDFPHSADDYFKADYDRGQMLFSADIAIFDKDYIKYIIDVVDQITIDKGKLKHISNHFRDGIYYYQVLADDILNMEISEMENLKFSELL